MESLATLSLCAVLLRRSGSPVATDVDYVSSFLVLLLRGILNNYIAFCRRLLCGSNMASLRLEQVLRVDDVTDVRATLCGVDWLFSTVDVCTP